MENVITVYETEEGGSAVEWNKSTGAVRVLPDGEWMPPESDPSQVGGIGYD